MVDCSGGGVAEDINIQMSNKITSLIGLLLADAPLDNIVRNPEEFDDLCWVAEDLGWVRTQETPEGILYTHPRDPNRYRKFFPYSLFKGQ